MKFNFSKKVNLEEARMKINSLDLIGLDSYLRVHGEVADNEELAHDILAKGGYHLQSLSKRLKDNEVLVKQAVTNYPDSLSYASERIKDKEEFQEIADKSMIEDPRYYELLSNKQKMDKKYVERYLESDRADLGEIPPKFYSKNRDIAKKVLAKYTGSLRVMPLLIKNDEEMVKVALRSPGLANSQFMGWFLRNSEKFADYVAKEAPHALADMSYIIRSDRKRMLTALSKDGSLLSRLADNGDTRYCNDLEAVKAAVSNDGRAYRVASDEIKSNVDVARLTVKSQPFMYNELVAAFLTTDPEVMVSAARDDIYLVSNWMQRLGRKDESIRILDEGFKSLSQEDLLESFKNTITRIDRLDFNQSDEAKEHGTHFKATLSTLLVHADMNTLTELNKITEDSSYSRSLIESEISRKSILGIPKDDVASLYGRNNIPPRKSEPHPAILHDHSYKPSS